MRQGALPPDLPVLLFEGSEPGPFHEELPGGLTLLLDNLLWLRSLGVRAVHLSGFSDRRLPSADRVTGLELTASSGGTLRSAVLGLPGGPFLLCTAGSIRRTDPAPLLRISGGRAAVAVALAPRSLAGGQPVLTSPDGSIAACGKGASGLTNACDSGLWLCGDGFAGLGCLDSADTASILQKLHCRGALLVAEVCPGYTRRPGTPEEFLRACGEILCGTVPWPAELPGPPGVLLEDPSSLPGDVRVAGFLWVRTGVVVGEGCGLENCVLLSGSRIGAGCRLRNCLVLPGASVPEGTEASDKYIRTFGKAAKCST